jgi:hypothetical protein
MINSSKIRGQMEVIGADGVHIGIVERVENGRIRLTKADTGEGRHKGHHHFRAPRTMPVRRVMATKADR